jgi:uncharacterized delta-60 repeat protein
MRGSIAIEALERRALLAASPSLIRDPSAAGQFVEYNGNTYFSDAGSVLRVTNGTAGGTFVVKGFGYISKLTNVGGVLYFTTDTGVWKSDGTPAGTIQILPMYDNIDGKADASGYTEVNGQVFFYASVIGGSRGLWKTDGTPGGTVFLKKLSSAESFTRAGDTLFFVGDNATNTGKELWKSDGTSAGTVLVKDIRPGINGSLTGTTNDSPIASLGSSVVFKANDGVGTFRLFVSDGSAAGTIGLTNTGNVYGGLTTIGGFVYYSAANSTLDQQIWKSDGTEAGTVLVKQLGPNQATGFANRAWQLTNVNGELFFTAQNGSSGAILWKSDGTSAGTVPIAGGGSAGSFQLLAQLTNCEGTLAFVAGDLAVPSGAYSLWTSDGTTVGTSKVVDTFLGSRGPGELGSLGSIALFTDDNGVGGAALWALQTATPSLPQARARGPVPYTVAEGATLKLHGFTTADALPGRPLTLEWDLDGDGIYGETGSTAQRGDEAGADPTLDARGLDGPSTYLVHFRISDGTGYSSSDSAEVSVTNVAPVLNVSGSASTVTEGTPFELSFSATDPGPDDISSWVVNWGDGSTQSFSGGASSATHSYPSGYGSYGIRVSAVDEDGIYLFDPPAALDATFGSGGNVINRLGSIDDRPEDLVVQPDGKIVTISSIKSTSLANDYKLAVSRYNPDGALDPSFGTAGRTIFDGTPYGESGNAVALQSDGRIVVSGTIRNSFGSGDVGASTLLLRLLPDGSLDPSFGTNQSGVATYDFGSGEGLSRLAMLPDGDILAAGIAGQKTMLARFNADGSLDPQFGAGGKVFAPELANGDGIRDMALQPDGKILIVPWLSSTVDFAVWRFNADGSADATFDGDGRVSVDFGGTDTAGAMLLQPDGMIILAGSAARVAGDTPATGNDDALVRLTLSGALDSTFGIGGKMRSTGGIPPGGSSGAYGVALSFPRLAMEPYGRLLLAGTETYNGNLLRFPLYRFASNGARDFSYGTGGRYVIDFGTLNATLKKLSVQPDGAPLIFAPAGTASVPAEALTRLRPPGLSVRVVDAAIPIATISGPSTVAEGATYTLNLSANDPDGDGIRGWVVRWGDGSAQWVDASATTVDHVYGDGPRNWQISAYAYDADGSAGPATASVAVTVTNVAPVMSGLAFSASTINEGQATRLSGSLVDPSWLDTFTLTVIWGDGTSSLVSLAAGATTFSVSHTYADDNPSGTGSDLYTPQVSLTDDDGGVAPAPTGGVPSVRVNNLAPVASIPNLPATAEEGTPITLTSLVTDVASDTFTYNWRAVRNGSTFATGNAASFTFTPTDNGSYGIEFTVTDDDGGVGSASGTIQVSNAAPALWGLRFSNASINEGESLTLSGNFADPGSEDSFTLTIDWNDGSSPQVLALAPGATTFAVPHQFRDDPSGPGSDLYTPSISLSDDDGGSTNGAPFTRTVTFSQPNVVSGSGGKLVSGDAHFVENRVWVEGFTDSGTSFGVGGLTLTSSTYVTQSFLSKSQLRGFFIEAADGAPFTLASLKYRIGSTTSVNGFTSSAVKVLVATTYDPTLDGLQMQAFSIGGSAQSTFSTLNFSNQFTDVTRLFIASSATVDFDDIVIRLAEGGVPSIQVNNVPPQGVAITAPDGPYAAENAILLNGSATDPANAADLLTYSWSVMRTGDVTPYASGEGSSFSFTPDNVGEYAVTLTVSDQDGGASQAQRSFNVGQASLGYVTGSVLHVTGAGQSPLRITANGADVSVSRGGTTQAFSNVGAVEIMSSSAQNQIILNGSMLIIGIGGGTSVLTVESGDVQVQNDLRVDDASSVSVVINAGAAVTFLASQHLNSLSLNGGSALVAAGGERVLTMSELTLSPGSQLDLADNQIICQNANPAALGDWDGAQYSGLTQKIAQGFANGEWDGDGIITSRPDAKVFTTTVGIARASEVLGLSAGETALWRSETVNSTSILIIYTYSGDANLDGVVNADDYAWIDLYSQQSNSSGYAHGDFNYDGSINADDYALIDIISVNQGDPL